MNNISIQEEMFCCKRDNLVIRGMQFYPKNNTKSKKYPAIIVSHGFTGNYMSMSDYCSKFVKMGYVAFCFNFCGGGRIAEDDSVKSDGASRDMTISTEVLDLIAVKEYVKGLDFVDENALVLAGFSQGGFVSGIVAAKCKNEIKKLIMIYPALCIPDHARRGCLGGASYDINNIPNEIVCKKTVISKKFHEDVFDMDAYLELSPYKGPVLILHGIDDHTVNYSYAIRAKESYKEGQCHLQLIREMGHNPTEKQKDSIIASIRQFLYNRKEILSIRIIITHRDIVTKGDMRKSNIYFTGYCDTKYFHGTVLPGGCDAQEHCKEVRIKIRAEYTLDGIDEDGERCHIHVVNQWGTEDWKPVIDTDSKKLAWLNDAELTVVIESGTDGPTVRIYAGMKKE